MRETFDAMKSHNKAAKAQRLAAADDAGWFKHTEYHWSMNGPSGRIDYWPSTGLVMHNKRKMGIDSRRAQELITQAKGGKRYTLEFGIETGEQVSEDFQAADDSEAMKLAAARVAGGEGLITGIALYGDNVSWEYSYFELDWRLS